MLFRSGIFAVAGAELLAGDAGASAVTGAEGADVSPVAACAAAAASGCCAVLGDVLEELEVTTVSAPLEQAARASAVTRTTDSPNNHLGRIQFIIIASFNVVLRYSPLKA